MRTKQRILKILAAVGAGLALAAVPGAAQKNESPEVLYQLALEKQVTDGDLAAAIELYKRVADAPGVSPALAAQALVQMGQAYQRQGNNTEARTAYERVVREYSGQIVARAEAETRLKGLQAKQAKQESCAPRPPGLVSWWRAEENAKDWNELNDGFLKNGVRFAEGKVGLAFQLDGFDDVVSVPDSPSLQFDSSESFTIELWWKRTLNNLPFHAVGKRPGCGPPARPFYQIGIDQTDSPSLRILNEWMHVTYVFGADWTKVYINGRGVSVVPRRPSGPNLSEFLIGGSGSDGCNRFGGLIDEVSVYRRGLAESEISAIAEAGSAGKCVAPAPAADRPKR